MVASAGSPSAIWDATFAPHSTEQSMLREVLMMLDRSTTPFSSKSMPLRSETAIAEDLTKGLIARRVPLRNWCGMTNTRMSASEMAFSASGCARTFEGSLYPGRYRTFSLT